MIVKRIGNTLKIIGHESTNIRCAKLTFLCKSYEQKCKILKNGYAELELTDNEYIEFLYKYNQIDDSLYFAGAPTGDANDYQILVTGDQRIISAELDSTTTAITPGNFSLLLAQGKAVDDLSTISVVCASGYMLDSDNCKVEGDIILNNITSNSLTIKYEPHTAGLTGTITLVSKSQPILNYQGLIHLVQKIKTYIATNTPVVNNAKLTLNTSGKGISGSQTFTANQSSAATFTVTLNSSIAGNRAADSVVVADAAGSIQTEKLKISSGATTKAHMEYNSTEDCIDFIFD